MPRLQNPSQERSRRASSITARSGEAAKISGYLGKSDSFDEAIADFAKAYADQNERDHKNLVKAVREGRLQARARGAAFR